MARLGTKQRPAIVRVRTEARAKEVASIFNEHGWHFILGVEPDKPENISDLNWLLKSQKKRSVKKVGKQAESKKVQNLHSRKNNNISLRTIHIREKDSVLASNSTNADEEICEYVPYIKTAKWHAVISGILCIFFFVKFLTTASLWYLLLFVLPLLYFIGLLNALVLNQRVILHGKKITIMRRGQPLTSEISDALYQVIVKNGDMFSFRFRFLDNQKVAQITTKTYKDGDKLRQHIIDIIEQENIDVDIIEK
jgi:hypothetical protein